MKVDVEILILDGCTRDEAEKYLRSGTTVFDGEDFEDNFETYMNEWDACEDMRQDLKQMIETKKPCPTWGWSAVGLNNKTYYIMYVN